MSDVQYFAVPDPDDASRMTYWRHRGDSGDPLSLTAYPPRAKYGPLWFRKPGEGRKHVVPSGLSPYQRFQWVNRWHLEVRQPWEARVYAAINADRVAAAVRFGAFATRCCCCGRRLTDSASKTYGIGPDCRGGLPDGVLALFNAAVGRAHVEQLGGAS